MALPTCVSCSATNKPPFTPWSQYIKSAESVTVDRASDAAQIAQVREAVNGSNSVVPDRAARQIWGK